MLYKEWIDDWLEYYVKPTVKDKTYNRYLEVSRQHLVPKLGDYNLDELTPIIIQKFITELMQTGNLRTGKGLSANSINGIIIVIRSSLTTAFSIGLMDELVVSKIKRPRNEEKPLNVSLLQNKKRLNKQF